MISKKVWKDLLPQQITVFGILLAHENELLSLTHIGSVLKVSKQYASTIVKDVLKILSKHKVQYNFTTSNKGIKLSFIQEKENVKVLDIVDLVIDYLNNATNKKYTTNNKSTIKDIQARVKEGFVLDDFKYVIDIKASKWLNTDMEQYLRPQTLFGNKFNSYLNERPTSTNGKQISKIESAINQTTRTHDWGLD